jgi:hypothetical protein
MDDEGLMASNLKPAPLGLTTAVTAKMVGDRPAVGKGVVHVPLEGRLVDQAKGGISAPDFIATRQRELEQAIRFLKRKCVLVDPIDRNAMVRRYRVSGIAESVMAEGVIDHARRLGMEANDG